MQGQALLFHFIRYTFAHDELNLRYKHEIIIIASDEVDATFYSLLSDILSIFHMFCSILTRRGSPVPITQARATDESSSFS